MFDGLLGRGFTSKCKSLIKPTKTRIEVLRKRAEAKQRFLKEDLAKLLANGLDINAYGRTEEFLAGLNLLSSYDYIDQLCDYTVKQLSSMQKQSECPVECREVVASLMFAAARFSDLPELRDLRDVFQERYGTYLEYFVNQKFVEKLSTKSPTVEKRIHLLLDVASEFSIKWDSSGFEKRMSNPSAFVQEKPKKHGPSQNAADKYKLLDNKDGVNKMDKRDVSSTDKSEVVRDSSDGREDNSSRRDQMDFHYRSQDSTGNRHNPLMTRGEMKEFNAESSGSLHGKRQEVIDGGFKLHSDAVNGVHKAEREDLLFNGRSEVGLFAGTPAKSNNKVMSLYVNDQGSQNSMHSTSKGREEETERLKSYNNSLPPYVKLKDNVVPPPYVKSVDVKHEASKGYKHTDFDPSQNYKDAALNGCGKIQKEPERPEHRMRDSSYARVSSYGHEKDLDYHNNIPLPKPRSVRRKNSKSSPSQDDVGYLEGDSGRRSSRRREHSRKGLQNLLNDKHYEKDEEERVIDKLLLHYSKKPSNFDMEKLRKKSQAHPSHQIASDFTESSSSRSRDVHDINSEKLPHPTRSISLPPKQTASSETKKLYTRANSFQPDSQAKHVHPKLPDYDDLAARFAALRGT